MVDYIVIIYVLVIITYLFQFSRELNPLIFIILASNCKVIRYIWFLIPFYFKSIQNLYHLFILFW